MNSNYESVKLIDFQTPLVCVAGTESMILAGSKSGIIYGWDIELLKVKFELKGHVSPVNDLLIVDDSIFSASDDKTIIEWSLEEKAERKTYKRLSTSSLGHLGPVNALSYCSDTLFSAGADLTVRRWNTNTGKHNDAYFGFTKSVSTVLCYNGSVFAGSEDFSVLMFKPSLPQNQGLTIKPTTTVPKNNTSQKKILRLEKAASTTMNSTPVLVSVSIALGVIIIVLSAYILFVRKSKKTLLQAEKSGTIEKTEQAQTIMDLATIVNSVMGISKHAAYLVENSYLAKIKRLAAGGGGEVFLAKIMDASLRKKFGDTVIQKVVFIKNTLAEEAFYQEVGIMILLNSFPHFCTIIGYTENSLSIVLKYYPEGSLYEWIRKNQLGKRYTIKIVKEISEALKTLHSNFLAHCDIKPQNVLIQVQNGMPSCYLTDFGITQVLSESIIAVRSFSIINLRGFSVNYASPEAFTSFRTKKYLRIDFKKFDVYSLACVVLELLTRKAPWGL